MKGLGVAALYTFAILDLCFALPWLLLSQWVWAFMAVAVAVALFMLGKEISRS